MKNYLRYLCAVLAVPLVIGLRYALMPLIGPGVPYVSMFVVTTSVAVLAGLGPAVVTGLLGAILTDYFFVEPFYILDLNGAFMARTVLVVVTSAFIGYMGDALRASRDKAEKQAGELRKERDFTTAVLDTAGAMVVVLDGEGRITRFNHACELLTHYGAGEVMGRVFWEFLVPPDELPGVKRTWQALKGGDFPNVHENHWLAKDGSPRLIAWSNTAIVSSDGRIEYVIGTGMDITQRKKAEDDLRQSRQDLDRAQEVGQIGSWRLDVQQNILTWSQENHRIFGLPKGTPMTYETFVSCVHPDDRQYVDAKWNAAMRGEPYDIEHRVIVGGEVKWLREKAYIEFDEAGTLLGGFGITQDITNRKEAEEALRDSREYLSTVVRTSPSGIFVTREADGLFLEANDAYLKLIGYPAEEVIGRSSLELNIWVDPEDRKKVVETLRQYGHVENSEIRFRRRGGEIVDLLYSAVTFERTGERRILGTLMDITERKRAEEAVLASELRYRRLFEAARDGILILDAESGRIVDVNPFIKNILGYSHEEILGKSVWEIGTFKNVVASKEAFLELQNSGYVRYENLPLETKDGRHISVEFISNVYLVDHSKVIQCNIRDITERVRIEEELRKYRDELEARVEERTSELGAEVAERRLAEATVKAERKRFEDVLEMMPAYALLLTPDYRVAYANRTFRNWFGDDNGRKCYEFLFNRDKPCEICETYTVLKTGKSCFWEWTGPNGHNYDIYDYPFTDTDGSPLIMEIGVDVTSHKQALKALALSEERYRSLTVATTQVIWTTAADGQVVDDMPSWRAFTGQTVDEMQGWGWINSLHPDDRERTAEVWSRSVRQKSLYETEYRLRRHDGEYRYVTVRGVPVLQEDGSIREWVGVCTDITEKKAAETELEKYRLQLEDLVTQRTNELARSNKDLEQFAYVASHDLQEPLRAVAGFVELLRRSLHDSLDAKTASYMKFAVDGSKRMQALINGLLEYSRIGQVERHEETSAKTALDAAIAHLLVSVEESGAQITFDDMPVVRFDVLQLAQLFQNLIGNAIKFRGQEVPRIHIGAVRDGDGWRFAVSDNGIGIEAQYADRIFLIFQRLHDRDTYPGTGIGLAICKRIVEHNNGKIWVESKPGKGSTFYFTVPDEGSH